MTRIIQRILIVDDDPFNNTLSKLVLRKQFGEVEIKEFVYPEEALNYIKNEFEFKQLEEKTILFLDINMPVLNGWDFLEVFKTFEESIINQFNIYILSSSIDPADIQQAELNPFVIDYIEKPLSNAVLTKIFK